MEDLISVIIPTYKRPFDVLSRAVQSVLMQTYKNFEIIIVDDSPDDFGDRKELRKLVESIHDDRIRYHQHENNKGANAARNTGIRLSRGEYIAFLDDDDEFLPKKLELLLNKIKETNSLLVYSGSNQIVLKNGIEISRRLIQYKIRGYVYDELMKINFIGSNSFVMIDRKVVEICGKYNEEMKSAQDYEYWLRIAKEGKVDYVDEPLVNYYIHEGDRISTNIDLKIDGFEELLKLNSHYLDTHLKIKSYRMYRILPLYQKKYGKMYTLKKWFDAFKIYPMSIYGLKRLIRIFFPPRSMVDPNV